MLEFSPVHFIISAGCMFLVFVCFFVKHLRSGKSQVGNTMLILFVTCFLLLFPVYRQGENENPLSLLRSFALTMYHSLKTLTGSLDIDTVETFQGATDIYHTIFLVLNYLILIIVPFLTSSLLISMIGDWADRIRYQFRLFRNYHVFSELNDSSLHLARHIRKNHPRDIIVFCQTKECSSSLLVQAKELGALNLHVSCNALSIPFLRSIFQFYLISTDEDRNLHDTEQLIHRHQNKIKRPILINSFAESGTGIQVVESMKAANIDVRFIDSTAMLCNNLLLKYPLYTNVGEDKLISVAIVGCDKTGIRMLKTIAWSGQIDGYKLKIRVYDKNAAAVEQHFLVQCPELKESCDIDFIPVNTESVDFEKRILENSADATYIVTAMGDDEHNIDVAVRLFQMFRIHRNYQDHTPKILARTRSSVKTELYVSRDNSFLRDRNIYLFGRTEDIYGKNALFYSDLERLSFAVHMCYANAFPESLDDWNLLNKLKSTEVENVRKNFLQSEYNRRSSMAAALHIPAKLFFCGLTCEANSAPTNGDAENFRLALEENPDLIERLAKNEHQRWNCFMRSEGYCQVGFDKVKEFYPRSKRNRDDMSKRHLCITDWDSLVKLSTQFDEFREEYKKQHPEEQKADKKAAPKKNPAKPEEKETFQTSDLNMIRRIPDIIRFVNWLKKTNLDQAIFMQDMHLYVLFLSCKFSIIKWMKEIIHKTADT